MSTIQNGNVLGAGTITPGGASKPIDFNAIKITPAPVNMNGAAGFGSTPAVYTPPAAKSPITLTPSGGIDFGGLGGSGLFSDKINFTNNLVKPGTATDFSSSHVAGGTLTDTPNASMGGHTDAPNLSSFLTTNVGTPGGGTVNMQGGNVTGYTPAQTFKIDTTGNVGSDNLAHTAMGDLGAARNQYLDAIQGLATAKGYSPEYIDALRAKQAATTQGATLDANLATGAAPGDTQGYAAGVTARAKVLNSLSSLTAEQALNVQELIRQGNINAASTLVDAYKPVNVSPGTSMVSPATGQTTFGGAGAYSDYQAQQTYYNLAQNFPDANIPSYNTSLTPQQNLQVAQSSATKAPSFQSRNLVQVALPGGGISFVQKNLLTPNADGTYSYVNSAAGAGAKADAASLATQTQYLDTTQRAYTTALSNLDVLQKFMQQYGINQSSVPIVNQLQNKVKANVADPGVIAAFQSSLSGLRAEYSQVLAKGGARSVETDTTAKALIPDDLSPAQLSIVTGQLNKEGANAIREAQTQVTTISNRLMNGSGSPTGGSGSGSIYDF